MQNIYVKTSVKTYTINDNSKLLNYNAENEFENSIKKFQ